MAFAVRSALAIGGLSLALATIHYPDVTPDLLLTAVFGGVFIGAGIGFAVRGGAVLDGTEISALLISKRSHLPQSVEIGARIITDLGRGVTLYSGRDGLSPVPQEILYCVVTLLEIGKVKTIARMLDPSAFIVCHALADVEGGVVKRSALH
jgi:uncharacterized membrane-anchored protein YitT (DUF2179 family)